MLPLMKLLLLGTGKQKVIISEAQENLIVA